jgi:hypothetical protein
MKIKIPASVRVIIALWLLLALAACRPVAPTATAEPGMATPPAVATLTAVPDETYSAPGTEEAETAEGAYPSVESAYPSIGSAYPAAESTATSGGAGLSGAVSATTRPRFRRQRTGAAATSALIC